MTFAAVTKNIKSMYSSSDFERLFIRYKAEASHGRVYYKDTRHQIVPVQVQGQTETDILSNMKLAAVCCSARKK